MSRNNILFLLIILLAIFLRFFYLGKIPIGFYSDEAAYGYNAFSILKTGRDEYGNFLPLAFKSFGDFKAPLYIYFMVPFIKIFGLSEFGVRSISAFLGIGVVILTHFLSRILYRKESFALISSFLVAILPFGLQFSRMAHENNLVVFLITLGFLFFILFLKKGKYIYMSFICFAASIYTYHDARVFTPLIIGVLFLVYRKKIWDKRYKVIQGLFILFLLVIPFIQLIRGESFWSRPGHTIIFSDKGIISEVNQERGEDSKVSFFSPIIFHNKIIAFSKMFLENYGKHYSFDFLFFKGDPVKIYQTLANGIVYLIFAPFLFIGLYSVLKRKGEDKWLLIAWFFLSPVPSSLVKYAPSASRMFIFLPIVSIIIALGFISTTEYLKYSKFKRVFLVFITVFTIGNIAYYFHYYYFHTPIRYAKEWHYGMRQVLERVKAVEPQYSKIWFSKNAWGYIYSLFYLQYPPAKYQSWAELSDLNEYGFGWVERFDKYIFDDFPRDLTQRKDTLFIGAPSDFSIKLRKPLYKIYYPNGDTAFLFADKSSF